MALKINIGCGKRNFGEDWIHVDGAHFPHVKSDDIFLKGYRNNVDVIYSSHLLEYFNREQAVMILVLWLDALKPGGELRLAVPDFGAICSVYKNQQYELEQFLGLLYGQMEMNGEKIYHKTCYDYRSLNKLLSNIGFRCIQKIDSIVPYGEDDHSEARLPHYDPSGTRVSLNITCYKPPVPEYEQ